MKAPKFWQNPTPSWLALLVFPLSCFYNFLLYLRLKRKGYKSQIPVLCVGNYVLGGAGKTPTALALCSMLEEQGYRCVFLSRGYGGRFKGPLLVDLNKHTSKEVGDEPLLLARSAPTIISKSRVSGCHYCEQLNADIIIMDDGMQNPSLLKDLTFAVWDEVRGAGNGLPFPSGPLRGSFAIQECLAQAIILISPFEKESKNQSFSKVSDFNIPVFKSYLKVKTREKEFIKGKNIIAFAGIGYPEKFFETVRECEAVLVQTHSFADHHPYQREDILKLLKQSKEEQAILLTTEKDYVRLLPVLSQDELKKIYTLPVYLEFSEPHNIFSLIKEKCFKN